MPLAYLTLLTGLAISAVAIYYSVIGLAAIFSAAVIPIIVMGAILELSKLVAAWWLKANWDRAPFLLKSYMLVSVVVLMLITSMGIFGFLSKAHSDQAITTGDVQAQVALYDEQIKVERENIANAQSLIKQLDDAVVGINASGVDREIRLRDGTTRVQSAAERALQVRRSQAKDRANLTSQIEEAQANILELQKKKAPIASNLREVEAKVGPIKYIAQLIYGDNPDNNLLEKAVTWVIITIVFVFDPLAVLLLLASQMSFQWARQEKERKDELVQEESPPETPGKETSATPEPVVGAVDEGDRGQSKSDIELSTRDAEAEEANRKIAEIEPEFVEPVIPESGKIEVSVESKDENETQKESIELDQTGYDNKGYGTDEEEIEEIEKENSNKTKQAMQEWKADNPHDSLKHQRLLFEQGLIEKLPWKEYLKPDADYNDNEAALEAAKWAKEQIESAKIEEQKKEWVETRNPFFYSEEAQVVKQKSVIKSEDVVNEDDNEIERPGDYVNEDELKKKK